MTNTMDTSTATSAEAPKPAPTLQDLQKISHDYHVPVSEETLNGVLASHAASGGDAAKSFTDYVKTTAQGLYPTFAPQIAAGIPTAYLLDPYRQVGKQVLGEQFEPNFQGDPKMRVALEGSRDPQTGRPVPMTLNEWMMHLKSEPSFGWAQTPQGQEAMNTVRTKIHEAFTNGAM